jgi:hypothetical protein
MFKVMHNGCIYHLSLVSDKDIQAAVMAYNAREVSQPEYDERDRQRIKDLKRAQAEGLFILKMKGA